MHARWILAGCLAALLGCLAKDDAKRQRNPGPTPPPVEAAVATVEPRVGVPVAEGSLRGAFVIAPYGIVLPTDGDVDATRARVQAALDARGYAIGPADASGNHRRARLDIGPPAAANLHLAAIRILGRGLSERDIEALATATQCVVFATVGRVDDLARIQHDGAAIARDAAGEGWIVDSATAEVFTPATFARARPPEFPIEALTLSTVHVIADDDDPLVVVETLGLERLGVPELRIAEVPRALANDMAEIVEAAAETLLQRGSMTSDGRLVVDLATLGPPRWKTRAAEIRKNGGAGTVTFRATWAKSDADDDMLVELALPSGRDATRMRAAITAFFGRAP